LWFWCSCKGFPIYFPITCELTWAY
jgi:hypothetical protein